MFKKYLSQCQNLNPKSQKPAQIGSQIGSHICALVTVAFFSGFCLFNIISDPISAAQTQSDFTKLLDHPNRLIDDKKRDISRRPGEILGLMEIPSGATVLELFSGSGYYTELLSLIVGASGTIIHHNNAAFSRSLDVALRQRFANNRLPNVKRVTAELNELSLKPNSLDAVLLVLTYHDFYFENPSWPGIDEKAFLARLYQAVKPGGTVGLIDHAAKPGAGISDASRLHRIEKSVVIADFQAAGFDLIAQSDQLSNSVDDHTLSVFDPKIRSKTDRFILIFRHSF